MKVFTLEIKLYLGFLVSPPPTTPWEVSKSYCGDRCNRKAVSISALHPEALQSPSAPRSPGTLCTSGRTQCTWGNTVPVVGWASRGGLWLPASPPHTHTHNHLHHYYGITQGSFTALKIYFSLPSTPGHHGSSHCLHSFAFSRKS